MKYGLLTFIALCLMMSKISFAQDADSLLLNSLVDEPTTYSSATFKSTRVINGQSVQNMKANQLDFRIEHRFGPLSGGAYQLWGLDQSNVFFGLDYGITDRIEVGVGRSTYEKTYNGFTKIIILQQSKGKKNMPVTMSAYIGTDIFTLQWPDPTQTNYFSSRVTYIYQLLVARKFNESFSFQISPTVIHENMVQYAIQSNDHFSVGLGGRYKLSKRVSFNAEYFYQIHTNLPGITYNPNSLSVGFDIETGGHVFQLMFTNSQNMFERGFINETTGTWQNKNISFGFNISRVFSFTKK